MAEIFSTSLGGAMNTPLNDLGSSQDDTSPKAQGREADNLDVFKKHKNVQKFMKKYRYQYHVTMLPDLAELARNAYQEGYWNGVGQHRVTDLQPSDPEAKSRPSEAQGAQSDKEQELEEIIHCSTGCANNADPRDGGGYCSCGAEQKQQDILDLIAEETNAARIDSRNRLLNKLEHAYRRVIPPIKESPMELSFEAEQYNRFVEDLSRFIAIERKKNNQATLKASKESHD